MTTPTPLHISRRHALGGLATLPLLAAILPAPITLAAPTKLGGGSTGTVARSNNQFGFALYAHLRDATDGNIVFSPYSISAALAMVYAGAASDTRSEIAAVFGFDAIPDSAGLLEAVGELSADLTTRGTGDAEPDEGRAARHLKIANAVWGEQTYPFSDTYLDLLAESFDAALETVDFIDDPEGARQDINAWVASATDDQILNIVPPDAITAATRLVLANAIAFVGPWAFPFDPERTEDGVFTLGDGSTVTVPFMTQQLHLNYAASDGLQVVDIRFAESQFALAIVLPDGAALDIDLDTVASAFDQLASTDIVLSLPRFRIEHDLPLSDALIAMGMPSAFDPDAADFSPMVDGPTAEPLAITSVLHKAMIDVDENGAEAAAATVVMMEAGAVEEPEEPLELTIDRPFLFALRDTATGTILFLGHILDPS